MKNGLNMKSEFIPAPQSFANIFNFRSAFDFEELTTVKVKKSAGDLTDYPELNELLASLAADFPNGVLDLEFCSFYTLVFYPEGYSGKAGSEISYQLEIK
jgi:hypothetical protein